MSLWDSAIFFSYYFWYFVRFWLSGPSTGARLLALPALAFGMLYLCKIIGFYDPTAFTVVLICASAPVASITSMYAEKFGSDTACASKLVSVSTVLSLATMPVMALLLDLL